MEGYYMFKLIIIDDEAASAQQFGAALDWENYGFSLSGIFSDSEQAMEYLKNNRVDLVFTDIKMPKYTGIDIAELCHSLKTPPYVIFVSAYSDFEYARQAIQYNICEYIIKPFSYSDIEAILIKVYNLLEQRTTSQLFSDNLEMLEQQLVFSELVSNNIRSVDILKEKLQSINLPAFFINNECAHIHITINGFDEYITKIWKYGKDKLYNAISYLTSSKSNLFCSSFAYDNDSFEILAININLDFENELQNYLEQLEKNLSQLLSISDISTDISYIPALSDFVMNVPSEHNESAGDDPIIRKSMEFIHKHYRSDVSLDEVAKHISLSRVYFCSYFKKITGENFIDVLNQYRVEKAKELLSKTSAKVSSIAEEVGYRSIPYFYKIFTKHTKLTPTEYRNNIRKESNE